jgi:hypothetical protein
MMAAGEKPASNGSITGADDVEDCRVLEVVVGPDIGAGSGVCFGAGPQIELGVRATPEAGSVLAHLEKKATRVGVANMVAVERKLRQDVATDRRTLRLRSERRAGLAHLTRDAGRTQGRVNSPARRRRLEQK